MASFAMHRWKAASWYATPRRQSASETARHHAAASASRAGSSAVLLTGKRRSMHPSGRMPCHPARLTGARVCHVNAHADVAARYASTDDATTKAPLPLALLPAATGSGQRPNDALSCNTCHDTPSASDWCARVPRERACRRRGDSTNRRRDHEGTAVARAVASSNW